MLRSILFSFLIFAAGIANAQELTFNTDTKFFVDGTSTVHDWTIESNSISGKLIADEASKKITAVSLNLEVESLESGKGGMDKKVYDAFDTKKNPTISFESNSVTLAADGKSGVAKGNLSMAGTTKAVEVPFTLDDTSGNWVFTGEVTMLMTTFEMKPPTAVFGTIKAGDEVKVRFEVVTAKPAFAKAQ